MVICDNCKHSDRFHRLIEHQDESARKALGNRTKNPMTPDPADGRHIYMRQMTDAEVTARQTTSTPREEPSLGGTRRVGPAHS